MNGRTVICEEGVEEETEDTPLRRACVQDGSQKDVVPNLDVLRSVAKDVQYPGTR